MHHWLQISNKNPDIKTKDPKQINASFSPPLIFITMDLHKVKEAKKKNNLPVRPDVLVIALMLS